MNTTTNYPLQSGKEDLLEFAMRDFDQDIVRINEDLIANVPLPANQGLPNFDYLSNASASLDEKAMLWIYCASQAFQFWTLSPNGEFSRFSYDGQTGSFAMFSKIRDHWSVNGVRSNDVPKLVSGAPNELARLRIANELSNHSDRLYFAARRIVEAAMTGSLGVEEAAYLAQKFPESFSDPYLKKAQLAVFAIGRLVEEGQGIALNYDLTAFADYQVPRVLRAMGVLEYCDALANTIDGGFLITKGSRFESAIRSATVIAVEKIAKETGLSSAVIDNMLWSNQGLAKETLFHRTVTTDY